MQAVILAGGKGERLKPLTEEVQKCMLPLCGRPLLEHHVELCKKHGITDIVMCVGYKKERIMEHFDDGSEFGIPIRYSIETELLGTGGAVKNCGKLLADRFVVAYGDVASKLNYTKLAKFHSKKGGEATIVVHPSLHPEDSDIVDMEKTGKVRGFICKPHNLRGRGYVNNAGCYVFEKKALANIIEKKLSMEKELFPKLAQRGTLYAYNTLDYLRDMGTFERYKKMEDEFCAVGNARKLHHEGGKKI